MIASSPCSPIEPEEEAVMDHDNNLADQLIEAMKHHQRNVDATKEAQKRLAIMEQLAAQIEQMQNTKSEK